MSYSKNFVNHDHCKNKTSIFESLLYCESFFLITILLYIFECIKIGPKSSLNVITASSRSIYLVSQSFISRRIFISQSNWWITSSKMVCRCADVRKKFFFIDPTLFLISDDINAVYDIYNQIQRMTSIVDIQCCRIRSQVWPRKIS